jgi:hypothetical protein
VYGVHTEQKYVRNCAGDDANPKCIFQHLDPICFVDSFSLLTCLSTFPCFHYKLQP